VIEAHSGTTGRARVRLTTRAPVPDTLFVKLQPTHPEQQAFVRMVGMGVAEARFYAAVGDELPVRIPRVWHSSFDERDDAFVMVLEDLQAAGCRFPSAEDDDVLDIAGPLMDELAALHAAYWGRDLPWLEVAAGYRNNAQGAKAAAGAAAIIRSALDQFADDMPPAFRRMGELYIDRFADINALYREGVPTLVHGDGHIGNLFVDGDRVGFYDWAVTARLPGLRDVGYFLTNSLPADVRRSAEDALVARYRAGLADRGVTLDERTAHDQYRLFVVYSWVAATTTAAMGSRWQPFEIAHKAMLRTTEAITDLDAIGLLTDRLHP